MDTTLINSAPEGSVITQKSRSDLSGQWGTGALGTLVFVLVSSAAGMIPILGPILIAGPFALGFAIFALKIARGGRPDVGSIFDGFQHFGTALLAYLMMIILVMIGFLLLIIPGIVLGIGLSQTYFIIADDRNIPATDALKESWEMMRGHKMDYFLLSLRFLGWSILCIFTLFIGFFWLYPYAQVSFANFYDTINGNDRVENISDHIVEY